MKEKELVYNKNINLLKKEISIKETEFKNKI